MSEASPMTNCEVWPTRSLQNVFSRHLASLGRPPTMEDYENFGFEDLLRQFYAENASVVRYQA